MTALGLMGALIVVLVGAYAFGLRPKALWDAGVAKIKAWYANWRD